MQQDRLLSLSWFFPLRATRYDLGEMDLALRYSVGD